MKLRRAKVNSSDPRLSVGAALQLHLSMARQSIASTPTWVEECLVKLFCFAGILDIFSLWLTIPRIPTLREWFSLTAADHLKHSTE